MSDEINNALDLAPINSNNQLTVIQTQESTDDFEYARTNLYDVAEKTNQALEDMIAIAQQSQHPKAYEVLNSLLKTMADVNNTLTEIQIKKARIAAIAEKAKNGGQVEQQSVTNNLFVGSTAELQKMLEDMKNGNTDS